MDRSSVCATSSTQEHFKQRTCYEEGHRRELEQPPELPQLFKEWIPSPEELSRHSAIFHQRQPPPTSPRGRRRWSAFISQPTPSAPTTHHHEPPPPDYFSLHPPDSAAPAIPSPSSSETPSPINSTSSRHSLTHLRRRFSSIPSFSLLPSSLAHIPSQPPHSSSGARQASRISAAQDGLHPPSRPPSLIHPQKNTKKKARHSLRNRLSSFFHLLTHHHHHPSPTSPNNPAPLPTNKTLSRHSAHLEHRSSALSHIPNRLHSLYPHSLINNNRYSIAEEAEGEEEEEEEEASEACREANRQRALADLERGGQRDARIPAPPRTRLSPTRPHSFQPSSPSPLQG